MLPNSARECPAPWLFGRKPERYNRFPVPEDVLFSRVMLVGAGTCGGFVDVHLLPGTLVLELFYF